MILTKANDIDIDDIERLLYQVHKVHSDARPDMFKIGRKKYTRDEIVKIMTSDDTPIYVCKQDDKVLGYAFVVYMTPTNNSLVDIKTMYIDDLCVDSTLKHQGIGSFIFDELERIARANNCYNMLLNVYNFNTPAYNFYLKSGMQPLKTYMEKLL